MYNVMFTISSVTVYIKKHVESTVVFIYQFLQQLKHKFTFLTLQINPLLSFLCLPFFFISLLVHLLLLKSSSICLSSSSICLSSNSICLSSSSICLSSSSFPHSFEFLLNFFPSTQPQKAWLLAWAASLY